MAFTLAFVRKNACDFTLRFRLSQHNLLTLATLDKATKEDKNRFLPKVAKAIIVYVDVAKDFARKIANVN